MKQDKKKFLSVNDIGKKGETKGQMDVYKRLGRLSFKVCTMK